jgi:hypothetical protein
MSNAESYVYISLSEDGFYHVTAKTRGSDRETAEKIAHDVLRFLSAGRRTFIRTEPTASSETDYDTGITHHRGYVRFSFKDEPGTTEVLKIEPNPLVGFGPRTVGE